MDKIIIKKVTNKLLLLYKDCGGGVFDFVSGKNLLILFLIGLILYSIYAFPDYSIITIAIVVIGIIGIWLKQVVDKNE